MLALCVSVRRVRVIAARVIAIAQAATAVGVKATIATRVALGSVGALAVAIRRPRIVARVGASSHTKATASA